MAIPRTRAEFVALAAAQDLNTARGQQVYAMLMSVAGAFAEVNAEAAITAAVPRSSEYLDGFFSEAERRALKLADSTALVGKAFASLNLAVPTTRDEFRKLAEAQDLSTERGRAAFAALMSIAGAFSEITTTATAAAIALATDPNLDAAQKAVADLDRIFAVIESSGASMMVRLQRKLEAATRFSAESADPNVARVAAASRAMIAGDMALLVSLTARYGGYAEQMFGLEKWRIDALREAGNSAAEMAVIEQSYQDRRNAILTGGVASGLSTLRDTLNAWLKSLLLNNQLTTLTPLQRLEEARRQYETALTSGNASQITGAADAYLREARDYFASGPGYAAIFNIVRTQVAALTNGTTSAPAPAPSGSVGGGNTAAAAASNTATAAANTAVAAANATVDAVNQTKAVLAEIMANVAYAINDEGEANREADASNTARIVGALAPVGGLRVPV